MAFFSEGAIDFFGLECLTYDDRSLVGEILMAIRAEEKEQMKKAGQNTPPTLPNMPKMPSVPQKYSSRGMNSTIPKFPGKR